MPISMTPAQYFDAFVLENYNDFLNNSSSVRHAFNAAVAASQMADHCFKYYKKYEPSKISHEKLGGYVEAISQSTNGYFRDIRSISNAYKHLYTGDDTQLGQYSSISSAGVLEAVHIFDEDIKDIYEDFSGEEPYPVIYTTKNGQKREFKKALETVVKFWEEKIYNDLS